MMLKLDTIGHAAGFNKKKAVRAFLNEPSAVIEAPPF